MQYLHMHKKYLVIFI
jgi:uncharacterized protein YpmS